MAFKTAEDSMMGLAASSPVPAPQVSTLAAPGKRGPTGMAPRVSNSRVNTGVAPAMDGGASEQKTIAPMGASMLQVKTAQPGEGRMATVMGRPSIQDMIQAAVTGSAERMSVNAEAMHQMKLAAEKCEKCGKSPCVCEDKEKKAFAYAGAPIENEKTASTHIEKVAAALEYAAMCVKEGSINIDAGTSHGVGPGQGPGALHVMESPGGAAISTNSGHAIPKNIPPLNPPMQKGLTGPHGGGTSLMKNDLDHAPGGPGHQHTALPNMKTGSAPIDLVLAMFKEKKAEDALSPASISAGRTVPPDTRESGQSGPASPQGASMVASSQSVTNLTRRDAKAAPKADMHAYLNQPALSAEHDRVLQNAFAHTGQAGAKIASAQESGEALMKTAAARAYLEKLVEEVKITTPGGN